MHKTLLNAFYDLFIKTQRLPVLKNRYTVHFSSFRFVLRRNLVKRLENVLQVSSTGQDYKKSQFSLVLNNLIITHGSKYQNWDIFFKVSQNSFFFSLLLHTHAENRRERKEGCALWSSGKL